MRKMQTTRWEGEGKTHRELKIEQAEDGYIVIFLDYTGKKRVFKSFRKLVQFLHGYFKEEKEHITITSAVE